MDSAAWIVSVAGVVALVAVNAWFLGGRGPRGGKPPR